MTSITGVTASRTYCTMTLEVFSRYVRPIWLHTGPLPCLDDKSLHLYSAGYKICQSKAIYLTQRTIRHPPWVTSVLADVSWMDGWIDGWQPELELGQLENATVCGNL